MSCINDKEEKEMTRSFGNRSGQILVALILGIAILIGGCGGEPGDDCQIGGSDCPQGESCQICSSDIIICTVCTAKSSGSCKC